MAKATVLCFFKIKLQDMTCERHEKLIHLINRLFSTIKWDLKLPVPDS